MLNDPTVTSYRYDAAGNRTGITYPSGRTATYTFDFAGRQTGVTGKSPSGATETYATGATYLPFGPLTALTFGNKLAQKQTFDERYRVKTRTLLNGTTPVASFDYGYDAGSNILAITDTVAPAFSRTFEYDDLSRLTVANSAGLWGAGAYEYDAMGNLTSARLGATVRTFNHVGTTPLLSSVVDMSGTANPSYDGAGNLLSAGVGDQRVYSARSLMASHTAAGAVLGYDYDGRNVRVSSAETANGMTTRTRMTYDSGLRLLEYRTEAATPTNFIWFGDHPVAQVKSPTTSLDGIGVDGAGIPNPTQAGTNLFAYVHGNPIKMIDPFGLKAELVCKNVGTNGTPIPLSRHCRLRVTCDTCSGGPPAIDVTVGMEYTGNPLYSINEWSYPSGLQGYSETWPVAINGKECDFTKCVRAYNKLFSKGFTGQATQYVPAYSIPGPNSNTHVARLIEICGGLGAFPPGAIGAPGALGSSGGPPKLP